MMDDSWSFGLLLVTGQMLHIESTNAIRGEPGNVWLDVTMGVEFPICLKGNQDWANRIVSSPTKGRTTASINAAHVVMAVELADT
jgi:hypothetical protein